MNEELTKVVTAITIADKSLAHHQSEVGRLLALRTSLAARLEELGATPPPAPARSPQGLSDPNRAAQEWLDELDRTGTSPAPAWVPPEQVARDEELAPYLETMDYQRREMEKVLPPDAPIRRTPEWTQAVPKRPYRSVEVASLGPVVLGPIRYERILIQAEDIPARFTIWALDGTVQQAHLKADISEFKGVADCGVKGPGTWWRPEREDMEPRVELCRDCAGLITGVVLPRP